MHHGNVVRIDPLPSGKAVEESDRWRLRGEKGGADPIFVEEAQEIEEIGEPDRAMMAKDEVGSVELGPPVDEWRHAGKDEIAAEIIVVEDSACAGLPESGDRAVRA